MEFCAGWRPCRMSNGWSNAILSDAIRNADKGAASKAPRVWGTISVGPPVRGGRFCPCAEGSRKRRWTGVTATLAAGPPLSLLGPPALVP